MKIKYLGHAAFELELESGARIVFDPYTAGAFGTLKYGPIDGELRRGGREPQPRGSRVQGRALPLEEDRQQVGQGHESAASRSNRS